MKTILLLISILSLSACCNGTGPGPRALNEATVNTALELENV